MDRYWFQAGGVAELLKLKWGVSHINVHKEMEEEGILRYVDYPFNFFPDFLTGTTHKIGSYERGTYYPLILKHFEVNLSRSAALIVIGYGFGDNRINDGIEKCFLSDANKPIFVVDIKKPEWEHIDSGRVHFDGKGVSGMDAESILKRVAERSHDPR